MLHRAIDTFTDQHPATKAAKEIFRPHYRLYSGAFVDVIYDHFLATDKIELTEDSLFRFSQEVYQTLENYAGWLPDYFAGMFPFMRSQNWLFNYRTNWGIEKSLGGVVRRAAYLSESNTAFRLFQEHYQLLRNCYRQFWADVKPFAVTRFDELATGHSATDRIG